MRIALACVVVGGLAAAARAQPDATPETGSEAARLFEAGLAARDAGRDAEACELFAQARAKDPRAIGAVIGLGLCNEKLGKIATAYALYTEALEFATSANFARQREAMQAKVAELAPQVPILEVALAAPLPSGKLVVDDRVVQPGEVPVDPGPHVVVYTAPGRIPFERELSIELGGRVRVEVAALALPETRTVVHRVGNRRRSIGLATAITGAGLLAVAGGLAWYANDLYDDQFVDPDGAGGELPPCGGRPVIDGHEGCNADGDKAINRARSFGTTATVLAGVGLAAAATGVILWLTAPSGEAPASRTARVVPAVSADGVGIVVSGGF